MEDVSRNEQMLLFSSTTIIQEVWQETGVDFNMLVNDFETNLIVQALKITQGNKKEAARLLNLKRTTLLEKIKKKELMDTWSLEEDSD